MRNSTKIFLYCYGEAALLKNYVSALRDAGLGSVISPALDESDGCGGLLLCGGGDSDPNLYGQDDLFCRKVDLKRDLKELALVRRFAAARRPILGICRGHQLLNFAFGGDLYQDLPTAGHHTDLGDRDRLHDTRIAPGTFLAELYGPGARVTSAHHQAVGRLAPHFRAIQWTADGVVEAMACEKLPIIGLQWHPERQHFLRREGAAEGGAVFRYFRALCEQTDGRGK